MENQRGSARAKRLSLVDLSSAFVLLGLGTSLAVLVFLFELIFKRIIKDFNLFKNEKSRHQPQSIIKAVVLTTNVFTKTALEVIDIEAVAAAVLVETTVKVDDDVDVVKQ